MKQHDAKALAEGYSPTVRAVEVSSVFAFLAGEAWLARKLWPSLADESGWFALGLVLLAYLSADFISGLFHWMGDTWGTPETPVVGAVFVRPFREHHVDQKAITRHDFFEVNGANCLIALPVLAATLLLPFGDSRGFAWLAFYLGTFLFFIFCTNQFHSWAHLDQPPRVARWLQRIHLILPRAHHAIHHQAPYLKYYCITNGWLNWPLHKLGFFRGLERVISALTGMVARQDDIGEEAARALLE